MSRESTSRHGLADSMSNGALENVSAPIATVSGGPLLPNRRIPLDLERVRQVSVNTSAVERRAQSQTARRTVKKEWQGGGDFRAVTRMGLATLSGGGPYEPGLRLFAQARPPLQHGVVQKTGNEEQGI